jgi:hypothetical protein
LFRVITNEFSRDKVDWSSTNWLPMYWSRGHFTGEINVSVQAHRSIIANSLNHPSYCPCNTIIPFHKNCRRWNRKSKHIDRISSYFSLISSIALFNMFPFRFQMKTTPFRDEIHIWNARVVSNKLGWKIVHGVHEIEKERVDLRLPCAKR